MSSNTEDQDLEDLERYIKGSYLGALRSDGSGITDASATVFADYTMQRIQALLKRLESSLKAEYEEKIREARESTDNVYKRELDILKQAINGGRK